MQFTLAEQILLSALLPTAASHARLRQLANNTADWPALAQRAEFHCLTPLLRFNLAACGLLANLPQATQQTLEQSAQTWAARHLAYVSEANRLLAALADAGIIAIPLKGAALMLGDYYPQAGLRPAIDLDLLIDPAHSSAAEEVAQVCGYAVVPGRTAARPRQRLPNELNHLAPRRHSNGLLLELHTRAFHYVRGGRAFGFAEMRARAQFERGCWLPAPEDLALHLTHHTAVDLQSTHLLLRTLADLHFIAARTGTTNWHARADAFDLSGALAVTWQCVQLLAESDLAELKQALQRDDACALLLETALLEDPQGLAAAARLLEYLDFSHTPWQKLGNLFALVFTNRAHLTQLYGESGNPARHYWRRPFDLLRKFAWKSLRPRHWRRVRRLQKLHQNDRSNART